MATTQEFYRLRSRSVRIPTQLQSVSNGMYLTNQNMPEGYVKVLVNYDIDDTGSCIKTRKGRSLLTTIPYAGKHRLGKMHLTDYIYTYNETATEVDDIKDLLMSFGHYSKIENYISPQDLVPPANLNVPMCITRFTINTDTNVYDDDDQIITPGQITTEVYENGWALYCDKGAENFNKVENENIGYISTRTIKNAYAYDKKIIRDLGKPISAVLANEIYAFSGAPIEATLYTANHNKNTFDSLAKADLTKLVIRNTSQGYKIRREVIEPKTLNPTEATASGYNILHTSPYLFNDVPGGAPRVLGIILYETQQSDIPILNPVVGTTYALRAYYQYQVSGATYQYKVETMDATQTDAKYTTIVDWTDFTSGNALWINFIPTYLKTLVRITIRQSGQTATESQLPHLVDCETSSTTKLENKEFDLSTAKGMISWAGCIGLYGVDGAADTIFFSDIEDASYFPFPNNTLMFDNEILAVHNYLDMLLVVTTDSIILVTVGDTIASCVQKKIMTNIFIPELDAINMIVLKDQIFFKTDTQFYVLKPNRYTSDATDLKNFTNSTSIANYTIKFTEETIKILNKVFRPITNAVSIERRKTVHFTDFDVINVQSGIKDEEVHYIYTIVPYIDEQTFGNLDLHLVYNTVTRSYRLYLKGVGDDNVSHTSLLYRNKQSGVYYEVIPYNLETNSNVLIVKESLNGRDDNIIQGDWQLTPYFNNYNYLDTGNVAINDTYNKRFRELQLNVVNHEDSKIRFYSDVKIDGKLTVNSTNYEIQNITDPNDPEYGLVYVIPTAVDNLTVYGDTTLEDEESELVNFWEVDLSAFPDLDMATVKLKLFGKGRRASLQLLCTDLKNYELSTFVWVYRVMNVR